MAQRTPRSLKHEYELFVEGEIENYKESVPRNALLSIGDEAVAALAAQAQFALTELLLCEEVDRIIRQRIRLPSYSTWRRRRVKQLEELRRPEHWGLDPEAALVRTVRPFAEAHVLVTGSLAEAPALYLAANGCEVSAVHAETDAVQRVLDAAAQAGLGQRVRGYVMDLTEWAPESPLSAVICTAASLAGLSLRERERVIGALQDATMLGGVHYLDTAGAPSMSELKRRYRGWQISVETLPGDTKSFVARKAVA